jgi:hypothetical protein
MFKRSRRLLQGKADYSVWYDIGEMDTNFVIVEAKTKGGFSSGQGQCLAYMAMVHKIRKYENRQNSIVFGCCAASFNFILL